MRYKVSNLREMLAGTNLKKTEFYIFTAFLILNLIPLLFFKFLPTLDGPAHLHNTGLLKNLLIDKNTFLNQFYELNTDFIPNWTGHFILMILSLIFPAFVADKIFMAIYLILLPLSFRWLVKAINHKNTFLSFLVFPFSYSFTFLLGFYNFSIALVLMFAIIAYWLNHRKKITFSKIILLFILNGLLYFSHIFIFGITFFICCCLSLHNFILQINKKQKQNFYMFFKEVFVFILSALPGLIFSILFFIQHKAIEYNYISKLELLKWIKKIRPVIAYNFSREGVFTQLIFGVLVILCILIVYKRIKNTSHSNRRPISFFFSLFHPKDIWGFFSILFLVLYFFMPDSNGYSGFFSVRMGLLFFLFFVLWISLHDFKAWVYILTTTLIFSCNTGLTFYYVTQIKQNNKVAKEVNDLSKYIKENKVVLPYHYHGNWLYGHFSNYLGIDKVMVILENYECGTGYFPVKWNTNRPEVVLKNKQEEKSCSMQKENKNNQVKADFVFILGYENIPSDSCTLKLMNTIKENYNLIAETTNCRLYEFFP